MEGVKVWRERHRIITNSNVTSHHATPEVCNIHDISVGKISVNTVTRLRAGQLTSCGSILCRTSGFLLFS
jgi:hypothetical protein